MAVATAPRMLRVPTSEEAARTRQRQAALKYVLLGLIGIVSLTPFILAFLGTFKTDAEIIAYPPKLLPDRWLVQNWIKTWGTNFGEGATFPRWLANTAVVAVGSAILQVVACSMAAYAFARLRFPGKNAVFSFMLASMMIPGAVTLIPAYVVMTKISFVNTYWSLLVPGAISAGNIFLLTQFLKAVPRELEEAAFVDGASRFRIYKDVVLPLARPALLTVFILQFQGMWNAFMAPLLYLNTPKMWVLNVAISSFQQQYKAAWNLTLVAAMFNAIPVLILFAFFSRYYIEGVSYAGLKG
ncbi:MAG: carbohydrate ABC transporter permease [Anaerolineae bacterium]|uniref:carbohydrate ABC transporter permease n=1 Tax=Candidatus Amarolinea dominans TaxID=3140696 RepID=UPI001DEAC3EC|nr:carbohydrate ABC transporter permease [Anaerolineae bacterium]MBK7199955.1 carbohydrate ABC transporter permease [Anaerolineae bacterium]MBK9229311.1 carbohydrate ABC transporter permease [Anaerolineae bacterium]